MQAETAHVSAIVFLQLLGAILLAALTRSPAARAPPSRRSRSATGAGIMSAGPFPENRAARGAVPHGIFRSFTPPIGT